VLLWINEQSNILHELRKRKAKWIGHILRRNCLLKHVIEGKIKGEMEVTRRRGRRRRKLLDDLKERRGYSHLKEEALDRTMWRNRFGGGFETVVRQNTEWMMNVGVYLNQNDRLIFHVSNTEIMGSSSIQGITLCLFLFLCSGSAEASLLADPLSKHSTCLQQDL